MLAQNFKTPADLLISDIEFESLLKVLGMLERGEIRDSQFDMASFRSECGTVGCLCGWAFFISEGAAFPEVANAKLERLAPLKDRLPIKLQELFDIGGGGNRRFGIFGGTATPSQAAFVLRNFLTTGEPNWAEVLS